MEFFPLCNALIEGIEWKSGKLQQSGRLKVTTRSILTANLIPLLDWQIIPPLTKSLRQKRWWWILLILGNVSQWIVITMSLKNLLKPIHGIYWPTAGPPIHLYWKIARNTSSFIHIKWVKRDKLPEELTTKALKENWLHRVGMIKREWYPY